MDQARRSNIWIIVDLESMKRENRGEEIIKEIIKNSQN